MAVECAGSHGWSKRGFPDGGCGAAEEGPPLRQRPMGGGTAGGGYRPPVSQMRAADPGGAWGVGAEIIEAPKLSAKGTEKAGIVLTPLSPGRKMKVRP